MYKITAVFPLINQIELIDMLTKKIYYYKARVNVSMKSFKVGQVFEIRIV